MLSRVKSKPSSNLRTKTKFAYSAMVAFYALIMLEGILMATPFGLFLYSFYRPFLEGACQNNLTAWIAAFFMPHSVYATNSPFLEFIRWKGPHLFYIGLAGFVVVAFQVYWAKIRRKGMVNNFIYAYIRHPQYLFFMLSGIGLLFMWPRMMMLVLFTMMSIFYFYLAKFEENRMQSRHPEYETYKNKTAMFIPGNPGGKIYDLLFGRIGNQKIARSLALLIVVMLIFGSAIGLRNLTAANISKVAIPEKNLLAISIFLHDEHYLRDVIEKTLNHHSVQKALSAQGKVSFTAHILPENYGMLAMFVQIRNRAEMREHFRNSSSLRELIWGSESNHAKIVFSKIGKPDKDFVPVDEIMDMSARMTPVLVADVNLPSGKVENVRTASANQYGNVPQPIF